MINTSRSSCATRISPPKVYLPTCQDTGTIILGKKGQRVWTGGSDEAAWPGVYTTPARTTCAHGTRALDRKKLTLAPTLAAQIEYHNATDGDESNFLCIAKAAASANKNLSGPGNQSADHPGEAEKLLVEKMCTLGLPPVRTAFADRRYLGGS